MSTNPLTLGRKAKPTRKHRPAIWECMLGTVYAMNNAGEVLYFDYRWDEAVAYAGVTTERDPRVSKTTERIYLKGRESVPAGRHALWVRK